MNWAHLFMPNESPVDDGPGSFDADSSLFLPNSDFFENLPPSSTLPPRPPSIPPDLEPAPLFTPKLAPLSNPDDDGGGTTALPPPSSYSGNALGLRFDLLDRSPAFHADTALQQRHTFSYSAAGEASRPAQPAGPPPPIDTLFDNNEENYLNSFLNSFDADGFDFGTYLASPPPMANFSSNTDFTGMGMGMGVGAGMMGAMDDAIPHLSVDENAHDTTHGISHMTAPSAPATGTRSHAGGSGGMLPMRRQSFFDYGMGGTSHLSLGNVMAEEMHKVSSWLLQNQDHQSEAPQSLPTNSTFLPRSLHRASVDGGQHSTHASLSHSIGITSPLGYPAFPTVASGRVLSASAGRTTFPIDNMWPHDGYGNYGQQQQQQHRPPSESEQSVKRKASIEQIGQPRKARGSMWSPMRETAPSLIAANSTTGVASDEHSHVTIGTATLASLVAASRSAYDATAPEDAADTNSGSGDEGSIDGDGSGRRDHKKSTQRTILTEDERRANHIASEQRRRNQIRQGYAELMNMVTTLRDPALGNHPGTAQSTPSKAVILSHAVQFIRNLEDGNRQLRERLEGTRHLLPPMHLASQALASLQSRPTGPPQ